MDIKQSGWLVLWLSTLYLSTTSADTATTPVVKPENQVPAAQTQEAAPAVKITAEVWNRTKGVIVVSQTGQAQKEIEKGQSYQSQNYPEVPINILVPNGNPVKYITVSGQKGACGVPVCIFVQ